MTATEKFGTLADGRPIEMVILRNANGIQMKVITYGAIIVSLDLPDSSGRVADVVLGFDDITSYVNHSPYFGSIVGRYANRIRGGVFELDGTRYHLSRNEGRNCLHGGAHGFDKAVWAIADLTPRSVRLTHTSGDGDQGFPGALETSVTYTLADSGELDVEYEATTSAPTVINLTQHTYWNLGGADSGSILGHELMIDAKAFTPVDAELLPTGEIRSVERTPFDFRSPERIGTRINAADKQLALGLGYDHNFVLEREHGALAPVAVLTHAESGRSMEVRTTEPGLQLYTGNRLDGTITGKNDVRYLRHAGLCLETQHFPDSPNNPQFPSTVLVPGGIFKSRTVFAFKS